MSWLQWHCSALHLWGKKHPLPWTLIKVAVVAGIAAAVVRIVR
jgi:negative regulator of sigma E activity